MSGIFGTYTKLIFCGSYLVGNHKTHCMSVHIGKFYGSLGGPGYVFNILFFLSEQVYFNVAIWIHEWPIRLT